MIPTVKRWRVRTLRLTPSDNRVTTTTARVDVMAPTRYLAYLAAREAFMYGEAMGYWHYAGRISCAVVRKPGAEPVGIVTREL